jgi:hypothetical protein
VELYLHFPNTPSWRGAQLKHRDNFTFATQLKLFIKVCSFQDVGKAVSLTGTFQGLLLNKARNENGKMLFLLQSLFSWLIYTRNYDKGKRRQMSTYPLDKIHRSGQNAVAKRK